MHMAPRVLVALLAASGMVWSDATATTMTHTITSASYTGTTTTASLTGTSNTETSSTASSTQTITVSLATGTTSSITIFTLVACSGDAETWDAGLGNCSTYAPGAEAPLRYYYYLQNYYYCDSDSDIRDGVLAKHACPECGRCILITTTTSAHSTTGTSTGTSTTSLHSTTDTSSSSTPHTTTGTTGTTVTQGPCTRAWYAQFEPVTGRDLPCTPVNGTCPMVCRAVYENAIVACDGTNEMSDGYDFYPQPAGAVVSRSLGTPLSQGVCKAEVAEALLSNVAYTPTCLDGLLVVSTEIDFCQADDNLTACPELCERIMDVAFDRCAANDTIYFGHLAVTAEELVESFRYYLWSPQCTALLRSKTFRGGLASTTPEELVPATTAGHSSSMKTSSGVTTMGMSSSGTSMGMSSTGTSGGMSDAAQGEEEITSSSYTSAASLLLLCWSASLLAMM